MVAEWWLTPCLKARGIDFEAIGLMLEAVELQKTGQHMLIRLREVASLHQHYTNTAPTLHQHCTNTAPVDCDTVLTGSSGNSGAGCASRDEAGHCC